MKAKMGVFEYLDYKAYVREALVQRAELEKGQRIKLAQTLNCQPSYISQVLNEHQNFSPEQSQLINEFLGHTTNESKYFLALVLMARAGTPNLRKLYQEEIRHLKEQHLLVKNRVEEYHTLSESEQARYYSSWHYAAIHVIVSLKEFRTKERIALALALPSKTVNEAVEFLIEIKILKVHGSELRQGETNLFLGTDSPFLTRHQMNWRVQALRSLDMPREKDLHYSGVITCSAEDIQKIRDAMVRTIQEVSSIVKDAKDETLYVYNLDLFGLLKQ